MSENEAIEALLAEFENDTPAQDEPAQNEAAPQEQVVAQEQQAGLSKDDISEAMAQAMQVMKEKEAQAQEQAQASQPTPEQIKQQQMLEQLGLGNLSGLAEQMKAMQEQMAAEQEAQRRKAVFNENIDKFEKEFPTIKPDELGEFAKANGYLPYLGEDYNMWKLVANTMLRVATPNGAPDAIVGNGGGKNELSAFDKLKKGEEVSDLEIGAELLKGL